MPKEIKHDMLADIGQKLPVKHVAKPDEIAEAYLFLMKQVPSMNQLSTALMNVVILSGAIISQVKESRSTEETESSEQHFVGRQMYCIHCIREL